MRRMALLMALACAAGMAQGAAEKDAVAAVQKLFDAMAAHDAAAIRAAVLPEARIYAVREEGAPTVGTMEDFAARIGGMQGGILERFTGKPKVDIRGRMAQVWGEYEFLRDGKFNHCGVDSVSLFQTAEGWKIAAIAYTTETKGCRGQ